MSDTAIVVFGVVVLLFASQSGRLGRHQIAAPLVFAGVGTLAGVLPEPLGVEPSSVRLLAEVTLALILFHDAAQVRPHDLRVVSGPCARLLLVGLPLTVAAGFGAGLLLFPDVDVWLVLLVAAALAPTDAGLGAATVLNPVVPARIRTILNVESGLNDGLATPVVLFAIAAAGVAGQHEGGALVDALRELSLGLVVGVVVGVLTGWLLTTARQRGNAEPSLLPVATFVVPLVAYFGCLAVHGNGFVAAFVAGTAYAAAAARASRVPTTAMAASTAAPTAERVEADPLELAEQTSTFLGYAVWTLFGLVAVAHLGSLITWPGVVFALLSLTVLRMLPVALVLLGTGLRRETALFVGWFGPRGLASVVFALIALEEIELDRGLEQVLGTITLTVLLSIVLHGATAGPWAARYGAWAGRAEPAVELGEVTEPAS